MLREVRLTVLLLAVLVLAACGGSASPVGTPEGVIPAPTPAPTSSGPNQEMVVQWQHNNKAGDILTNPSGMTLYVYKSDPPGGTACTGDCAKTWPPLAATKGAQVFAGERVPGKVATFTRPDGTTQVTYDNQALYTYSGDKSPGDTNGQGQANWSVVTITPGPIPTSAPTATATAAPPTSAPAATPTP